MRTETKEPGTIVGEWAEPSQRKRQIGACMQTFIRETMDFYDHLRAQPVCRSVDPETLARLEERCVPEEGRPAQNVYGKMLQEVFSNTTLQQHPRSFCCIPSTVSLLRYLCYRGWGM